MSNAEGPTPENPTPGQPNIRLYAAIGGGIALFAVVAALSWSSGGLPGTKNSPSATVHGQSTVGQSGAD